MHATILQYILAFFLGFLPFPQQARIPGPGGAVSGGGGGVGTGPCTTSNISLGNSINCVQAAAQLSGSTTNVLAYPKGSVTSANCGIAFVASGTSNAATVSDSQGAWTQRTTANETLAPGIGYIFSRQFTASGADTVTATITGGSSLTIIEASGITCAFDQQANAINSGVTTFTTGTSSATTTAVELVVSGFYNDNTASAFTLGGGNVLINSNTAGGAATITLVQAYTVASTGAQNSTAAVGASSFGVGMLATFH